MNRLPTIAALLAFVGSASTALAAPPGVEVIAGTGTPTANGTMSEFDDHWPSINDAGQIGWYVNLVGTALGTRDDVAEFRGAPGSITEIIRKGNAAPGGNGVVSISVLDNLSTAGLMGGVVVYDGTSGGTTDSYAIVAGTGGSLTQIVRQGQPMPDNNGTVNNGFFATHVSASGQFTFTAEAKNAVPAGFNNGIFRSSGGPISTLVRTGYVAPPGMGTINFVRADSMDVNPSGLVTFRAELDNAGDQFHDSAVFRTNGVNMVKIAREGDLSPDANGQIADAVNVTQALRISPGGNVLFLAGLLGTNGGSSDNRAILRGSGGPLTMIARKGQPTPDANGTIAEFSIPEFVGETGAIFDATLIGTSGGTNDDVALYAATGTQLTTILRKGQPAPTGDGVLDASEFDAWDNNAAGEVCYISALKNTQSGGASERTLLFHRPGQPLREVVRTGTPLLGSTIAVMSIPNHSDRPEKGAINQSGQIGFWFRLADGREGIARFTPPPTCLGDFNNDGERNTLDLTIFLGKFGQVVAPYSAGDMNGDGAVNTQDLTAFLGVFGIPCR